MHYLLNLFLASNCLVFFFLCVFLFLFYFFLMCLLVCIDYINASLLHIFLVVSFFLCAYARNTQFCVVTLSVWHLLPFSSLCHQQHIYCIFLSPFFLSSHPFSLFFTTVLLPRTLTVTINIFTKLIQHHFFLSLFRLFTTCVLITFFSFFDSLLDENSKDVFLLL